MPTTTTFRSFVVLATPFVVAFMLCSAALFAQTTNSVSTPLLNRDLPQTVREAKMHEAQTAANHLFSALQTNDEAAIFTLLPTREVYKAMIATHFYAHETERTKAYERLAKEYDGQVEQMKQNLRDIVAETRKTEGGLTDFRVSDFKFAFKETENLVGGAAALVLENSKHQTATLKMPTFYELNGTWYLLGKVQWKS